MKKNELVIVTLAMLVISSCQKEIDWGASGSLSANQILVKISSKTGTDSTIVSYTYNSQRKLIKESTTGISGGTVVDNELIINRNTSGVILNTVQKSPALIAAGIDSVITTYRYNSTTSIYTSSVFNLQLGGFNVADSAVYVYDAIGKITSEDHYLKSGFLPPFLALRNQYTYSPDGQDIIGVAQLAATTPGSPLVPVGGQTYSYDSKINPLITKNEAIVLARVGLYNAHNSLKTVVTNTVSPSSNFTIDFTYKYNSVNKPDSSFGTRTGGAVTVSKYFYSN